MLGLGLNAFAGAALAERDPYWDKVVLLLEFEGTDSAVLFRDERGHAATVWGGAQIDTGILGPNGGSTGLFDGTGDALTFAESADFNGFTVNDPWTVEAFIKQPTTNPAAGVVCLGDNSGGVAGQCSIETYGGQENIYIRGQGGTTGYWISNAYTFDTNWHHYRWVSPGTGGANMRIYRDGNVLAAPSSFSWTTQNQPYGAVVGANRGGSVLEAFLKASIAGVRVTKAVRNTGNFTVPTLPYPKG